MLEEHLRIYTRCSCFGGSKLFLFDPLFSLVHIPNEAVSSRNLTSHGHSSSTFKLTVLQILWDLLLLLDQLIHSFFLTFPFAFSLSFFSFIFRSFLFLSQHFLSSFLFLSFLSFGLS